MKRLGTLVILCLSSHLLTGQVVFRNDFVINKKLKNRGITHITFNVGARNIWNLNAYGQPYKSITVDVRALRGKNDYTYREIIEKMYRPMAVYRQAYIPIPLFLLLEPPRKLRLPPATYMSD